MVVNPLLRSSMRTAGPPHSKDSKRSSHEQDEGPVTLTITRRAKAGKTEEFERWLDGIIHEAMKFEGHMGVNVIRPSNMSNPEYLIILRFDNFRPCIDFAPTSTASNSRPSSIAEYTCRCGNNGSVYDLCYNAISNKAVETVVTKEKTLLNRKFLNENFFKNITT